MTTDTTDNGSPLADAPPPSLPPRRNERSVGPWLASLGLNAALVGLLFFAGHSVFELDRQAEQERTEEVRLRELARQELERQQRAQIQLTDEQADLLQKREKRQTRDELRVHIEKMREHRREMERLREEAFEKLRRRPLEEMVRQELEPLRRDAEQFREALDKSAEKMETPEAKKDQQDLAERVKEFEDLLEDTVENPEKYNERREEIQKEARSVKFASHDAVKEAVDRNDKDRGREEVQTAAKAQREGDDVDLAAQRLRDSIDEEEMNDIDAAATEVADLPEAAQPGSQESDPAELYNAGREVENQVKQMHNEVKAAALAASSNSSFGEAKEAVEKGASETSRPDLASVMAGGAEAAAQQGAGEQGEGGEEGDAGGDQAQASAASSGGQGSQPGSSGGESGEDKPQNANGSSATSASAAGASGAGGPTMGDVRAQREAMDQARREIGQMQANTASMVAQAQGGSGGVGGVSNLAMSAMMRRAASTGGFADMTGMSFGGMGGGGDSDDPSTGTDHDYDATGEGMGMVGGTDGAKLVIPEKMAKANALPGRVFTDQSARRGWLFLDTWWVIGPWDNLAQVNWDNTHPPEFEIDFDAEYTGKYGPVAWEFLQSGRIDLSPPPPVRGGSTYYAYTEIYSDRDRDVLVAVAADDAARLWINGNVIWQEHGQSAWRMGESQRLFQLQKGINTVLLRLENGPGHAIWSVLLAPPEAMTAAQ